METDIGRAWEALAPHNCIVGTGRRIRTPLFYSILRWTAAPLLRNLNTRWRGLANIPGKGPAILAANHLSHFDPLFVIVGCRRSTFYLTKDDHFKRPHTAWFMRASGQIETARESGATDALSSAIDLLKSDHVLGIFPEGTRSRRTQPPFLQAGKTGCARIAASMPEVPVIPVAHRGTREFMTPKIHKLPRPWRRVIFSYGKPITWIEWLEHPEGGGHTLQSLAELAASEEHLIKAEVGNLYRKFTDQLMHSISALGAP